MDALNPNSPRGDAVPRWMVPLLTTIVALAAIGFYWLQRSNPYDPDSPYYTLMAEGRIAEVSRPFTARILQPAVVGFLSRTSGLSIDASFFVTNLACLIALVAAALALMFDYVRSASLALAIVLCPMTLILFREIYMPDCMHAGLAAVFFLLLARKGWWWAVPLLFFMQVARDSTVLLTFALVVVGVYHRMWKMAIAAVLFTVLGIGVVNHVASRGHSNIHEQGQLVYLVGKVPFNVLTNVCGLRMWTNTHAKHNPAAYPDKPLWSFEVPSWLPTGSMRQVGIYSISPEIPLMMTKTMLTLFGVMPALVALVIWWRRLRLAREDLAFFPLTVLLYGVLAYLIGPAIGASMGRLIAYGWPMAWIAAPILLARYFSVSGALIQRLAVLQAIACWPPLLLKEAGIPQVPTDAISIAVAVTCYALVIKSLKQNRLAIA
jgi:hypothetical protein